MEELTAAVSQLASGRPASEPDVSRALSNRLKDISDIIIHTDQTYCVPDRTIMNKSLLMRDVFDVFRVDNDTYFGIVCLDQ